MKGHMMQALGYTILSRFSLGGVFGLASLFLASAILASVVMPSQPAQADFIDGRQLQLYCASQNPADEAICIVYITGAVDAFTTVDLIAEKTNGAERIFCMPDGVQPDQLKATTLGWLQRDATDLDFAATLLIWGAMKNAYSCS
jgi:hypothetical protein